MSPSEFFTATLVACLKQVKEVVVKKLKRG
jgi:hypothetical protein